MSLQAQQAAYKQNAMKTVSPGELTLMLYNGCLKFLKKAEKAIIEENIQERSVNILKAQDIIRELMVTLKTDNEVGKNMLAMYDYILNLLIEANIKNDPNSLKEAEQFVIEFRDTWKEVIQLDRQQRHGTEVGGQA